jgi:isorenieratene synthase
MSELIIFGRALDPQPVWSALPDWQQADPRWINQALQAALAKPGGGWFVVDERRKFGAQPRRYRIDDRDFVFWHGKNGLMAASDTCPHLGASLADSRVRDGCLVCPWHGLELGERPLGKWAPLPVHDDGVLVWIRLDDAGEQPTERPIMAPRPATYLDATVRMEARCRPEDILANRLDPWHGAHFHPHTFGRLRVIERGDEDIIVRVAFLVLGRLAVEVDARFHCPDPRTIIMTIVGGDGVGSVVETHATPIDDTRCAVIETTLATSDRPQMKYVLPLARWIRPLMEKRAARLWVEDVAYAERRCALSVADAQR